MPDSIADACAALLQKSNDQKLVGAVEENALNIIMQEELAGVKETTLVAGAEGFLHWLVAQKMDFAILSNNNQKAILEVFKKFNLPKPVLLVGGDSVKNKKPDLEGLQKILAQTKRNKKECLLIGDSNIDLEVGLKAEIPTIILPNKKFKNTEDNLGKFILVSNFEEVKVLIAVS